MSDKVPPQTGPVVIDLKPTDFSGARRQDAQRCLIANAVRRTFPDVADVAVYPDTIEIDGAMWRHDSSEIVQAFDHHRLYASTFVPGTKVTMHRSGTR